MKLQEVIEELNTEESGMERLIGLTKQIESKSSMLNAQVDVLLFLIDKKVIEPYEADRYAKRIIENLKNQTI